MTGRKRCTKWLCSLFVLSFVLVIFIYNGLSIPELRTVGYSVDGMTSYNFTSENYNDTAYHYKYKVVCMILTRASNWATKGKAVRNTWAERCYRAVFFYSRIENCYSQPICSESSAVGLNVPDGRDHLTAKTLGALDYSYAKYGVEADYFLKADDDTYVIMENLQEMISRFKSIPLLYLGRKSVTILHNGYNSGGAGYVISKEAVKLLTENRTKYPDECLSDGGYEDVEIGRCLAKFGIYPQDETDTTGKLIFHSDNPLRVFQGDKVANAYYIDLNGVQFGNREALARKDVMLSKRTATMHYVTPAEMYMYDFLLYHLNRATDIEQNSTSENSTSTK